MTQGPNALASSANAGYGLASFLLGAGTSGFIDHVSGLALQRNYYAGYVQDDWKLTPKLTANLGAALRRDHGPDGALRPPGVDGPRRAEPPRERGRARACAAARVRGRDGNPRNQLATDRNNVAPRVGLAYQASARTALRAGYGIFYVPMVTLAAGLHRLQHHHAVGVVDRRPDAGELPAEPVPAGLQPAAGARRDPANNVGFEISGYVHDERVGYTQQWNLSAPAAARRLDPGGRRLRRQQGDLAAVRRRLRGELPGPAVPGARARRSTTACPIRSSGSSGPVRSRVRPSRGASSCCPIRSTRRCSATCRWRRAPSTTV